MKGKSFSGKALICAAVVAMCLVSCGKNPKLNSNNIPAVIKAMSLEEKVALVMAAYDTTEKRDVGTDLEKGYSTTPNERLGIPSLRFVAPSGFCDADSVQLPCNAAIAASWDMELIEEVAHSIAEQVGDGVSNTILLAPSATVLRNSLAGGAAEYFSEDPLLTGLAAAAYVNGIQKHGVLAALQGFVAANQTTNAEKYDVVASPRALREIYLRSYELALENSKPAAVSASANRINGTWCAASTDLLNTVLRDEWGFGGIVTSANTKCAAVSDMVAAGCDFMAYGSAARADTLVSAIVSDSISVDLLDRNVERLLAFAADRHGLAMLEQSLHHEEGAELARSAAADAIVLLENRYAALPISDSLVENIAVFEATDSVALMPRFAGELAEKGFTVVSDVDSADIAFVIISREEDRLDREISSFDLKANELDLIRQICGKCHDQDKFVTVILNVAAAVETASWKDLPDALLFAQKTGSGTAGALADIVTGVVNPSARLAQTLPVTYYDVPSARNFPSQPKSGKNQTAGMPRIGYPGMAPEMTHGMMNRTGVAKADSSMSRIPRRTRSSSFSAASKNSSSDRGTRNSDYFLYQEGIFVGYRFYDSFSKEVSYPFGYGLSYTNFSYGEADVLVRKNSLRVMIDITNSGSVAGREVVQVYTVAPDGSLDKPSQELRAFSKTALLQPGETAWLTMDIPFRYLASFNESSASWSLDAGTYILKIGSSSRDIRSEAAAMIDEQMSYDVHDVLTQKRRLGELHARWSIFRERLSGDMGGNTSGKPETLDPNAPAPVDTLAGRDSVR